MTQSGRTELRIPAELVFRRQSGDSVDMDLLVDVDIEDGEILRLTLDKDYTAGFTALVEHLAKSFGRLHPDHSEKE